MYSTELRPPSLGADVPEPLKGITITFRKRYENNHDCEFQWKATRQLLYEVLKCRSYWDTYLFVPEFTENGRIHYHGYFRPKGKAIDIRIFKKLRKHCGFIKVEHSVRDMNAWKTYMFKEKEDTARLCNQFLASDNILLTPDDARHYFSDKADKFLRNAKLMKEAEENFLKSIDFS